LVNAKPECAHQKVEDLRAMLEDKFDIEVVEGTHDYH